MTRTLLLAAAVLPFLLAPLSSTAAENGNAAEGRIKATTCFGCHGITGWKNAYPNYHVPRIGDQNYEYIVSALTSYRTGERSHPTMRAQGESMTDQDIHDIAAYLSGLSGKVK